MSNMHQVISQNLARHMGTALNLPATLTVSPCRLGLALARENLSHEIGFQCRG